MKTMLTKLSFLILTLMSFSSFALDKVTITGQPVVLEEREGVFYLPSDGTVTSDAAYHYVTINGKNRVCYVEKQPALANLDLLAINMNVGGTSASWNCYEYDAEHFTVAP